MTTLPEYQATRVQAPAKQGIGLRIPPRRADCSGVRPSWYPFVFNVCDLDTEPLDMFPTARHLHLPPPPA